MSASVAIAKSVADAAKQIPLSAVINRPNGESIVWVLSDDNTVKERVITLGLITGNRVIVTSGLEIGDRVAIAGATALREGMRVRELGDALGGRN
jgi:multidrug efflux pump subunit AcrA (membrane-fusion protein)